ncbi:MAG TPA: urease accessory protein UreE [Casimicrobiaceae bacterium]|nr:urease accessory protein UreE [Casimicrobiaceae bacterium]
MITFDRRAARGAMCDATLTLDCEARRKSRVKVTLDSGEQAGIMLQWGELLCHGDVLATAEGRLVRIVAAPEPVMLVRCSHPRELARVAYHLGNRHVAVEVGEGVLKLAPDHVLRAMVQGLGAEVELATLPFEPEPGAYGAHAHDPSGATVATKITGSKQAS